MNAQIQYAKAVGRERSMASFIPQRNHITPDTIITKQGDLQRTWRLQGIAFETADIEDIHARKMQLNTLLRSIGSSQVAIWQHTCPRIVSDKLEAEFQNKFCRRFDRKYFNALGNSEMIQTDLYLTLIYRPVPSAIAKAFVRGGRRTNEQVLSDQQLSLRKLDELAKLLEASLTRYKPEVLATYYDGQNRLCSEALSFLNYLITGQWQKVQVPTKPLDEYLGNARMRVGAEMIELRTPNRTRFAQCIDFKDYNSHTEPGILNGLLYQGFEFVMTQSFSMRSKRDGETELRRQRRHLSGAGDGSAKQIVQLDAAIDQLIDGEFVMGEYHYSLMVYGDTQQEAIERTNLAMNVVQDQGFIAALVSTASDAAFYAQLPCNWFYRPRLANLTSRNFTGLASLHNFPKGKRDGNPWGQAVTMFKTPSGQPFYFNFHAATSDDDKTDAKLLGNTRIIGHSSGGKTVLLMVLLMQMQKYQNGGTGFTSIFFDKDQGARIGIKALGGKYLTIRNGEPTGLNPFQIEPTEANRLFLETLVKTLAERDGQSVTVGEELTITRAVSTVMDMPHETRRLSMLLQNITEGTEIADRDNSLVKRLSKWCADDGTGKRGSLAWVLDCETDEIDFTTHANYGIDGTDFLSNEEVRTPIALYLIHRMESVIDGRRFACMFDEGWRWIDDPVFKPFAGDKQPTIRKQNGICIFATQMPKSVLNSSISGELIEQMATEIYLPNPKAKRSEYVDGFNVSDAEFQVIKNLQDEDHMFLVKQDGQSVIAWLDLEGFDDELAVLSGSAESNALLDELLNEMDDDPALWLPEFHKRRKTRAKISKRKQSRGLPA